VLAAVVMLCACACNNNKVYDRYQPTPLAGWEKMDTLLFDVPAMAEATTCVATLGLRASNLYPFTHLTVVVEETILPSGASKSFAVNCALVGENGRAMGSGISYRQYEFPIDTLRLQAGDSLHIAIRHDMKREILPGISDVGYRLATDARGFGLRRYAGK